MPGLRGGDQAEAATANADELPGRLRRSRPTAAGPCQPRSGPPRRGGAAGGGAYWNPSHPCWLGSHGCDGGDDADVQDRAHVDGELSARGDHRLGAGAVRPSSNGCLFPRDQSRRCPPTAATTKYGSSLSLEGEPLVRNRSHSRSSRSMLAQVSAVPMLRAKPHSSDEGRRSGDSHAASISAPSREQEGRDVAAVLASSPAPPTISILELTHT
mmetsp:Transcript_21952/g.49440  ORF Transcript_21952/g.49440 Transcript_21952/m.49440 type:complete len:213 (-) Transcript_21952:123-761(-)